MSNWKAGDKALCVDDSDCDHTADIPNGWICRGTVYLVTGVREFGPEYERPGTGLAIAGKPAVQLNGDDGWSAERFRKIVPACDRATAEETGLIPHEGFWQGRPDL